jgi:hypothetical protein
MSVNHCRADIAVAEEFLNRADVIAILKQRRCKRMPERMRGCGLCQAGLANGLFHDLLQNGFVQVMSTLLSGFPIRVVASCGKYPLPAPLFSGVGIFWDPKRSVLRHGPSLVRGRAGVAP